MPRHRVRKRTSTKAVLVESHLEYVSRELLDDRRERRVVGELLRSRQGIYALYRGRDLYYVGLARNLMVRLTQHLDDRHGDAWDHFSIYVTMRTEHSKELESLVLRIARSTDGNKAGGKFRGSSDLMRQLKRRLKEEYAARQMHVLGERLVDRMRQSKGRRTQGAAALARVVTKPLHLHAKCKGKVHRASLQPNGSIRFGGATYDSPSAAGKAAVGRSCNGWSFWHYRDDKSGDWVPLSRLPRVRVKRGRRS